MPDPIRICIALCVAALVSAGATFAFGRLKRLPVVAAGVAAATLGALFLGVWILGLPPRFPPREDLDRLLLLVLPATAAAQVVAAVRPRWQWLARGAAAFVAAPLLLHGSIYVADLSGPGSRTWSAPLTWLIFAVLAALLLAAWALLDRLATTESSTPGFVALAILGAGVTLMLSGYASGGQVGLALAAATGGASIASLIARDPVARHAVLGLGLVGLFSLVIVGHLFAGLTWLNAALLFAAPLLAWLPQRIPGRPAVRTVLRGVAVLLPIAAALVLAQQEFAAKSGGAGTPSETSLDDYMQFGK